MYLLGRVIERSDRGLLLDLTKNLLLAEIYAFISFFRVLLAVLFIREMEGMSGVGNGSVQRS